MLRFNIGRIPVEIHPSHLVISAVFGLTFVPSARELAGWPPSWMAGLGDIGNALAGLTIVAAWMLIVSGSVLIHELGHAAATLASGHDAVIRLVAMGGHTQPQVKGPLSWGKDVFITAAGPAASFLLTLVAGGAHLLLADAPPSPLGHFVRYVFFANAFWTVLNLLPVMPLDGGRLTMQFGKKLLGRTGIIGSQLLALAICAVLVVLGLRTGQLLIALFFGFFGYQTFKLLMAILNGEAVLEDDPPMEAELVEADTHLREGRLDEARRAAQEVLTRFHSRRLVARANLILGWVALKEANGRLALTHFGQAQGLRIPPSALAASFSLIGDEQRALPFWEVAWSESQDPTVLHEWGGALIRAGRADTLQRLPGLRVDLAYVCAARTPFLRGAFSEAAELAEAGLERAPSAELAYDAACAHARSGDTQAALRCLARASELGFNDHAYASTDDDLARLHGQPAFHAWLTGLPGIAATS